MSDSLQNLPGIIKKHFTSEVWSGLTDQEHNYYLTYLTNPNHFFFRSSFLHQTAKKGLFSQEEKLKFIERLKYFRETLKIQRIPWGYFSIPFDGRAGYQCAMHYRDLLLSRQVDIDINYPVGQNGYPRFLFDQDVTLLTDALDSLECEIVNILKDLINKIDLSQYNSLPPNFMLQPTRDDPSNRSEPKVSKKSPKLATESTKQNSDNEEISESVVTSSQDANIQSTDAYEVSSDMLSPSSSQPAEEKAEETEVDANNPIPDFIDPITKEPIKDPMLDINGFVMGKQSWEKCLQDPSIAPCTMAATCMSDLIELTNDNFDSMKVFIINLSQT